MNARTSINSYILAVLLSFLSLFNGCASVGIGSNGKLIEKIDKFEQLIIKTKIYAMLNLTSEQINTHFQREISDVTEEVKQLMSPTFQVNFNSDGYDEGSGTCNLHTDIITVTLDQLDNLRRPRAFFSVPSSPTPNSELTVKMKVSGADEDQFCDDLKQFGVVEKFVQQTTEAEIEVSFNILHQYIDCMSHDGSTLEIQLIQSYDKIDSANCASTRNTISLKITQLEEEVSYAYQPLQESNRDRKKRDTQERVIDCAENIHTNKDSATSPCCRRKIEVDMSNTNLDDYVIAPAQFTAYYCVGRCVDFGGFRTTELSYYAELLQTLNQVYYNLFKKEPCCAPTSFTGLQVTVKNMNEVISNQVLGNLIVHECGCI